MLLLNLVLPEILSVLAIRSVAVVVVKVALPAPVILVVPDN